MLIAIQILSAVFLLLNKWFLIISKKKTGWVSGIIGSILLTIYLYLQMIWQYQTNVWILIISNLVLSFLMLYGYFTVFSREGGYLQNLLKKWNIAFKSTAIILTIIVCIWLLVKAITAELVLAQFVLSVASLLGTLLLAFDKRITNIGGWILYFIAHSLSAYVMFKLNSPFLSICQAISLILAIRGIMKELSKKELKIPKQQLL